MVAKELLILLETLLTFFIVVIPASHGLVDPICSDAELRRDLQS